MPNIDTQNDTRFPVLMSNAERRASPDAPRFVAWSAIQPFEAKARSNHGQTLHRLAERGGMSPKEMYAIAHNLGIGEIINGSIDDDTALAYVDSIRVPD